MAAIAVFCLAALWVALPALNFRRDCADFDTTPLRGTKVVLTSGKAKAEVGAEVALSDDEKRRGLMCRKKLPDGSGMLFPYEKPVSGGFWMFNTYIDLDILYIAQNGTVIKTVRMKPCPRGFFENRREWKRRCHLKAQNYMPHARYTAALELPAGYLERKGFSPQRTVRVEWNPDK